MYFFLISKEFLLDTFHYDYHILTIILTVMIIIWSSIYYFFRAFFPTYSDEFACRLVTYFHGVIAICSSTIYIVYEKQNPFDSYNYGKESTIVMQIIFSVSLGYFIYDFVWCVIKNSESYFMMFHHIISIAGLSVAIFSRRYGFELLCTILGTEITNPLLQLRWFLKYFQHKCLRQRFCYCSLINLGFFVIFFFFRIVLGSLLLYLYLSSDNTDLLGRIGGFTIYVIGWIFWIQILRFVIKKFLFHFTNQ